MYTTITELKNIDITGYLVQNSHTGTPYFAINDGAFCTKIEVKLHCQGSNISNFYSHKKESRLIIYGSR